MTGVVVLLRQEESLWTIIVDLEEFLGFPILSSWIYGLLILNLLQNDWIKIGWK